MIRNLLILSVVGLVTFLAGTVLPPATSQERPAGLVGDGKADDTAALQNAIDGGAGHVDLPKGVYRITKPIVIDLDRVGFTSITGNGVARIVMSGAGPAFRFVGTHEGTAAPDSFQPNVWAKRRTPMIDGLEIVGDHPEACGVEASGTMQLTLTRLVVRDVLHAVHLTGRNRNVLVSECHLYHNCGIGVFLDHLNLHQINICNSHISYNAGGGVVSKGSEVRNLQIGTCDIEGNMGGPDAPPSANVWLAAEGGSMAEVAIVGCTIQHAHDSPESANIRFDGDSPERPYTDELRHGNLTIADNVLSDVRVNVEIRNARGVTITGNTFWQAYDHDLTIDDSQSLVVTGNVFDRNPRYHYGDGATTKNGIVITNTTGCTFTGNHIQGVGDIPAAVQLRHCRRVNVANSTILDHGQCGLLLDDVSDSRVSDCLIDGGDVSVKVTGGSGNMIVDNRLDVAPVIENGTAVVDGNVVP